MTKLHFVKWYVFTLCLFDISPSEWLPFDLQLAKLAAVATCPLCYGRYKDPVASVYSLSVDSARPFANTRMDVRAACGHEFCTQCLDQWMKTRAGTYPGWTPEHLNNVFCFGMDPRTAADAMPLLLRNLRFMPLAGDISSRARDSMRALAHTTKKQILGPIFDCPACRKTLLVAPTRSHLVEKLLSKLPDEPDEESPSHNDTPSTASMAMEEGTLHELEQVGERNGSKQQALVVDWSKYFGNGLGHRSEGYNVSMPKVGQELLPDRL